MASKSSSAYPWRRRRATATFIICEPNNIKLGHLLSNLEAKPVKRVDHARARSMSKIIEGKKDAQGLKIGIVVSRYQPFYYGKTYSMAPWTDLKATAGTMTSNDRAGARRFRDSADRR